MKINENELTTNQYRAVKSIHIDKKRDYSGKTFAEAKGCLDMGKLRVQKKAELKEVEKFGQIPDLKAIFKN